MDINASNKIFYPKILLYSLLSLLLASCEIEKANINNVFVKENRDMEFKYGTETELNEILNQRFQKGDSISEVNGQLENNGFSVLKDWEKNETVSYIYIKDSKNGLSSSKTEIRAWFSENKLDKIVGILSLTSI